MSDSVAADLRRARPDEGLAVADVWLESRRAAHPAIPAPAHSDDDVRAWMSALVTTNPDVWVAEQDGVLVAVMVLDGSSVEQLYVLPEWTGRGVGSRLIERAKELRPQGLRLWAFTSNRGARRFYEQRGFVAVAATSGANEEHAPDVHYVWRRR
jgi:GNAT superfamily N-acetyltransferase